MEVVTISQCSFTGDQAIGGHGGNGAFIALGGTGQGGAIDSLGDDLTIGGSTFRGDAAIGGAAGANSLFNDSRGGLRTAAP